MYTETILNKELITPCNFLHQLVKDIKSTSPHTLDAENLFRKYGLTLQAEFRKDVDRSSSCSSKEWGPYMQVQSSSRQNLPYPWSISSGDSFYLSIEYNGTIIINANVPCPPTWENGEEIGYKLALDNLLWEIKDDSKNCPNHCDICSLFPLGFFK